MCFMKKEKRLKKLERKFSVLKSNIDYLKNADIESLIKENNDRLEKTILDNNRKLEKSVDSLKRYVENVLVTIEKQPFSSDDIDNLKKYVDISITEIKSVLISSDDIKKLVLANNADLIHNVQEMLTKHNESHPVPVPSVEIDYDKLRGYIENSVSKAVNSDETIKSLSALYKIETEKNHELEERVKALEEQLKTSSTPPPPPPPPTPVPVPRSRIVFSENSKLNEKNLERIIENTVKLKEVYSEILGTAPENEVYYKTVDNCIKKFQKIYDKLSSSDISASKIAGDVVSALKATIIKNFSKKELQDTIDSYLLSCFFEKKELSVGHKLEDTDYEYIGEMPLDVLVDDITQNNVIQDKGYDSYLIWYKEDNEKAAMIIEGNYSIGKYKA